LDQDNIDALLTGTTDTPSPEEAEPLDDLDELNQDNIDNLLAGNDTPEEAAAPEATGVDEVGQDDIDALFNDIDAATAGDDEPLGEDSDDQSIDELFAEDDTDDKTMLSAEVADEIAETAFDSEFDEMDQLFAELEDDTEEVDDPFQAEEIDFAEMLDSAGSRGDDEFLDLGLEDDDEDEFAMAPEAEEEDNDDETDIAALLSSDDGNDEDDDVHTGMAIPAFISGMNKATMSAIGSGLALLLIIGFYFIFSGNDAQDLAAVDTSPILEQNNTVTPPPENFIPLAENSTHTMDNEGSGMAIELQGSDEDGQPLIYQITSNPAHGRLSGTPPNFTYLANNDFPGEDSFEYTVNDGIDTSTIALVTITGPNLQDQALAQKRAEDNLKKQAIKKVIKPQQPVVLAQNVHFSTESTTPVTIDWRRIWKESNKSDFNPKIHVKIIKAETAGVLDHASNSTTIFTPDPFSERTDRIYYHFKKDGFRSATKTISIDIDLGNPAPEINFAELKQGYLVGQNVHLDTSPSRDDAPASLQFSWEQVSGVPVSMQIPNDKGQHMSFVMPSSFYSDTNSHPTFRVTATDKTGKTTSTKVQIKTISRRQTALWRGRNGSVAEEPALKGQYFPWPYTD
ncbi:MAG: Ig-like domain-containing protein, partial [Spirochaetales bacterium]|nr:Ig-like domain-containing protein [Spirochaetales bacterium]